ncbi:metal ABC transporter permease [Thermoflavimicrobium dichotomicum]|nr:metal ABC transporter permease [Thermoflavimicrobium dichotomicum]
MLQFEFMQRALIAGVIVGFICPLIGIFLVVRRLSLIAEALSHVSLSGVATGLFLQKEWGWLVGIHPVYVGMLFSVIGSLFVEKMRKLYHSYQELALPILLSGGMGIGVVLISAAGGFNADVAGYLFGSIVAVKEEQLTTVAMIGIMVSLFVFVFYKQLFSLSFDEENAILTGIPHRVVNLVFIVMVGLVISSAIQVVGILLVSSLITLPVAVSLQIANSFRQAIIYAIIFAEIAVLIGFFAAYSLNLASGGAIVLVSVLIWLMVVMFKRIRLIFNRKGFRRE